MEAMHQQLYPCLSRLADGLAEKGQSGDQSFRLTHISELDTLLTHEIEARRRIQKKYQRAINIAQGISTAAAITALGMETTGIPLMVTGVGALPGIVLSAVGAGCFFLVFASDKIRRKCAAKAEKRAAICQTARAKLNSIHQLVSTALTDSKVSDEEFKTITDEYDRYQNMKEELQAKARGVDNATKKEWLEQGRICKIHLRSTTKINCICGDASECDDISEPPLYSHCVATAPPYNP